MGGKGEGDEEREGGWRKMRGREDGKGGGEEKERETREEEGLREGKKEDEIQRWEKRREENKHRTNQGGGGTKEMQQRSPQSTAQHSRDGAESVKSG